MSKLTKKFTAHEWNKCCGSFCKDCNIANSYREKFGKKDGKKKFNKDFKNNQNN